MVILDSNHTAEHVLQELEAYGPLVSPGCYMVVFDTLIEELSDDLSENRPWGRGNNPATAIGQYLERAGDRFEIDHAVSDRLLITAARDGYLRRL
jgi:cephalosporin hydroxylase